MLASPPRRERRSGIGALGRRWLDALRLGSRLAQLEACDPDDARRIAQDLGLTQGELFALERHGVEDVELLYRRMTALRLDHAEFARAEPCVLREFQARCSLCQSRRRCARGLADEFTDPGWEDWRNYCPNATMLAMYSTLQSCGATSRNDERGIECAARDR